MKSKYEPIDFGPGTSLKVSRFDKEQQCPQTHFHLHSAYEIVYVRNGKGMICVENYQQEYKDGVLVFFSPNIPHFSFGNQEKDDNYEIVIQFDQAFINDKLNCFPEFSKIIQLAKSTDQFLIFDPAFKNEMAAYFEGLEVRSKQEKLISVISILAKLADTTQYTKLLKEDISQRYMNYGRIKPVLNYINANYANKISTQDVAHLSGLTTNSFCRMFKKTTHKSFLDYLNEFRINKALYLIENTDETISEIIYKCGFNNPSYFSKKFRQLKQMTPKAYRVAFQAMD